jgi:hypothetical protein
MTRISQFFGALTSAFTRISLTRNSLTRMGYNAIYEQVKDVYISWTFAYACWVLHNCSDNCEDKSLDDEANVWFYTCFVTRISANRSLTRKQISHIAETTFYCWPGASYSSSSIQANLAITAYKRPRNIPSTFLYYICLATTQYMSAIICFL